LFETGRRLRCPPNDRDPLEQALDDGRRVLCWLHGPDERIPEGGEATLEREEIAVAEEA
jgi:peptide/nickel transport system ATP-binding protein